MTTSLRLLRLPFNPGATLGYVGNGYGEMSADRDLAEEGLHGADFRNGRVGESAHVILNFAEVGGEIRISHGNHNSAIGGVYEHVLQECTACATLPAVGITYTAAITAWA